MSRVDSAPVKFRASSVGNLLVGGNAITDKQLDRLAELEARQLDPNAKPLTANMQKELDELIAKRDGEFKFGATALTLIRNVWLKNEFGYEEPLVTNELVKGIMCEDEAMSIVSRQLPEGGFRVKNDENFEDDWFTGTPDTILDDVVEDIKCSWSLRTFVETTRPDSIYYAQGQVYMSLTGLKKFRLVHVLCETPFELVEEERKKFYFRFNCNEEDPHYKKAVKQVDAMHAAVALVPERHRVKFFEFDFNEGYLDTLRRRVEQARLVYDLMTLGGHDE